MTDILDEVCAIVPLPVVKRFVVTSEQLGDNWIAFWDDETDIVHAIPANDLHAHSLEDCACCPETDNEDGDIWVIHNAFDGRDQV